MGDKNGKMFGTDVALPDDTECATDVPVAQDMCQETRQNVPSGTQDGTKWHESAQSGPQWPNQAQDGTEGVPPECQDVPKVPRETLGRMPGDEPDEPSEPASRPTTRESRRPPPMPAFVQGVDEEDRADPPATFTPDNEKIRKLVEEKASAVRAGQDYPIERNFPKWKSALDLKREATRPINWQVQNLWTERAKILLAAEQKAGKCVARGTKVWAPGGPPMPIEQVVAEQREVWTWAPECGFYSVRPSAWLNMGEQDCLCLKVIGGDSIVGTPEHPIYCYPGVWKRLDEIRPGEVIARMAIRSLTPLWDRTAYAVEPVGKHEVFDLSIPDTHCFVANGFLAHNTWIVCHTAISVAAGRPLFGTDRFRVMTPGPVGIVAGEDDPGEIGRRMDRMCRAAGLLMSDLPIHFLEGHGMRLNRQRDQEMMKSAVRALGLKLIVYDPLARLMDGDENSKEVVAALLNPASQLALDEGVSVMVVHHLGKQNNENPRTAIARVRGSSDITSWFSCGLFLSGQMRGGKLDVEVVQRTSGNVPNEFPVYVREDQDTSVYGLGSMRLEADLAVREQDQRGRNQALIEEAAREILLLVRGKANDGVTLSEIQVHLGYGRALTNAAVKKLVREDRSIMFEDAEDIPEKKVLVPRAAPRPTPEQRPAPDPRSEPDDDDEDFDAPTRQGELPLD